MGQIVNCLLHTQAKRSAKVNEAIELPCDKSKFFAIIYSAQHFRNNSLGQNFSILTRSITWLNSFEEPDVLLARWIEKPSQFGFEIKHEVGKKIPHAHFLSRVSETEGVKDCDQVNQVNKKNENIWFIGLGKSVEQLDEHQKTSAELVFTENTDWERKSLQMKTWRQPPGHCGNFGLVSENYEYKTI